MRALIWLILLSALAVGLALFVVHNDGYVLIVVPTDPPLRVELSLNLAVFLAVASYALLYALLRIVVHTLHLPAAVAEFRARRRHDKGERALREAMRFQFEGRYGQALKSAALAYDIDHAPGLAALAAMRAAHALRDAEKQDMWRERAIPHDEETRAARLMSEAEAAIDERRFDDAVVTLESLAAGSGRHIAALRLLLRARQGRGDWEEALRLIRQLEKHRALTPEQAAPLRLRAHRELLRSLPQDSAALARYWRALPAGERRQPALAQEAARALMAAGDCAEAQRVVEEALDENWDSDLALIYADCARGDSLGRIARAEKWLHQQPRDAKLLLALGRLCRYQQLWGKAESYLEASQALEPSRAAHRELAQLFDLLERPEDANRHYRSAAELD